MTLSQNSTLRAVEPLKVILGIYKTFGSKPIITSYIKLNSWFTEKRVPSVKSLGELTWGSYSKTWRFNFGNATRDCKLGEREKKAMKIRSNIEKLLLLCHAFIDKILLIS